MAPHSNTFAWKILWTEEPGRLQSMGSLGVGYDWATSLSLFTFLHWRRKWQPTPVFLPGESQGRAAWWAAIYGVAQSWTRLKRLSSGSSSSSPSYRPGSVWRAGRWPPRWILTASPGGTVTVSPSLGEAFRCSSRKWVTQILFLESPHLLSCDLKTHPTT